MLICYYDFIHYITLLDLAHNIHAFCDLAKNRMLAIQMRLRRFRHNKELAAIGVWTGIGHGQRTDFHFMRGQSFIILITLRLVVSYNVFGQTQAPRIYLVRESVSWPTSPVAIRISTLDDKTGHHAMEG